MFEGKS